MIISGGINVFPAEIEALILRHPGVSECAVIGLPSDEWGQQITAFVVGKADLSEQELRAHIEKTGLSRYKQPREYRFVEDLPRGNTGKVSRKILRNKVLEG